MVVILACRYVDDCLVLWKGSPDIPDDIVAAIKVSVRQSFYSRYPLPLEVDVSSKMVGLELVLGAGSVRAAPSTLPLAFYSGDFDYPPYMHYCSFVPATTKRALVLGFVARVQAFTLATSDRPHTLIKMLHLLARECGFPQRMLHKWCAPPCLAAPLDYGDVEIVVVK